MYFFGLFAGQKNSSEIVYNIKGPINQVGKKSLEIDILRQVLNFFTTDSVRLNSKPSRFKTIYINRYSGRTNIKPNYIRAWKSEIYANFCNKSKHTNTKAQTAYIKEMKTFKIYLEFRQVAVPSTLVYFTLRYRT